MPARSLRNSISRMRSFYSALTLLLVGCQTYEPAPLDLSQFDDGFTERLRDPEPIQNFAQRLEASGAVQTPSLDLDDGLTCAEAEVIALFYNPSLRRQRAEAGIARAIRDTAGLWEDPVFGFDAAEIISPPTPFEFGVMGSLSIPLSGRLDVEKERASAAYEAQLRSIVDAEWDLRARVRQAWVAWTTAQESAALAEQLLRQIELADRISTTRAQSGELNRVQQRLIQIELAERRINLEDRRFEARVQELQLLETLGLPTTVASLLRPGFPLVTIPEVADDSDRLIDANTDLAVHFAQFQVAEDTLRLEITEQFPDLVIGSGYGSQFNDRRVMFGLTIPVPILNANQAAIAEAAAAREVARAEAEETYIALVYDLAEARQALDVRRQQYDRYTQEILPLLIRQQDQLNQILTLGEIDLFLLVETARRTIDAKTRVLELAASQREAAIRIVQLLGPPAALRPAPVADPPESETQQP